MSLGGPIERPGRLQLVPIPEEGDFGILEAAASQGRLCTGPGTVMYRSKGHSGGVVSTQHRPATMEDARAGGAWRVWVGLRSGWGVSNLCQLHRNATLPLLGGNGNIPGQDCHGRRRGDGVRRVEEERLRGASKKYQR